MRQFNLNGHWENKSRSLQFDFNDNTYSCYCKLNDGSEKRTNGTFETTEIIKDNILKILFSDFPEGIYLYMIFDNDNIIIKDDSKNLQILTKQ